MDIGLYRGLSEVEFYNGKGVLNCVTSLDKELKELTGTRRVGVTPAGDAVIIRNATKSYSGNEQVLKGLDMTVPCGSIYGLLGSSGCGKTTLLSCIVGIRKLDDGKILIFGEPPGTKCVGVPGRNVGYMPQEISLYMEFSIGETFNYFGTLKGMRKEEVLIAIKFFLVFLNLPGESRLVGELSGGQQRRVSLVVALLGDPELLILDEPTVGVDPIIRQNIWQHLRKLVESKRTTVIVTTHYIEECRSADNIGIMRNGVLLEERPPQQLMIEYNSTNLERIVLSLSKIQQDKQGFKNKQENTAEHIKYAKVLYEATPSLKDSFKRIEALTGKNFVILLRNPLLLFFVIFASAFMLFLVCLTLGQDPSDLKIGLFNEDVEHYLTSCSNLTQIDGECNVNLISCRYLQHFKPGLINFEVHDSEGDAIKAVQNGTTWGYLHFPKNFSQAFYERFFVRDSFDVEIGNDLTFNSSNIMLRLDESNFQIAISIKMSAYKAFEEFIEKMLADCGYDVRQGKSSLKYNPPIFGQDTTDFRDFLAPAAALFLIFFFPVLSTSIRYIKEKKTGVLHRSIVSGVQTWEIMVAYSISEFCVLFLQTLINYVVIQHLFGIELFGSHVLLMTLYLVSGYGGVAMGFVIGSFCTEEIQAALLGMASFIPNMLLSGILWPREGMAEYLQYVVPILPCTLAGEAARSIGSRGWDFSHPNVCPGFAVMTLYIFGFFFLTILSHVLIHK